MTWDGNGHTPTGLTLTDDEVLLLAGRFEPTANAVQSPDLVAVLAVRDKLVDHAEEILNRDRGSRR